MFGLLEHLRLSSPLFPPMLPMENFVGTIYSYIYIEKTQIPIILPIIKIITNQLIRKPRWVHDHVLLHILDILHIGILILWKELFLNTFNIVCTTHQHNIRVMCWNKPRYNWKSPLKILEAWTRVAVYTYSRYPAVKIFAC